MTIEEIKALLQEKEMLLDQLRSKDPNVLTPEMEHLLKEIEDLKNQLEKN